MGVVGHQGEQGLAVTGIEAFILVHDAYFAILVVGRDHPGVGVVASIVLERIALAEARQTDAPALADVVGGLFEVEFLGEEAPAQGLLEMIATGTAPRGEAVHLMVAEFGSIVHAQQGVVVVVVGQRHHAVEAAELQRQLGLLGEYLAVVGGNVAASDLAQMVVVAIGDQHRAPGGLDGLGQGDREGVGADDQQPLGIGGLKIEATGQGLQREAVKQHRDGDDGKGQWRQQGGVLDADVDQARAEQAGDGHRDHPAWTDPADHQLLAEGQVDLDQ